MLTCKNITKSYAAHVALRDVSIEIPEKSVFGLLGPNGAGKTSLIRIINMITAPDTGEILFDNQPLHSDHIFDIGYLPEERGLYRKMKVGEQALYLARLKGMEKTEAVKRLKYWFEKFEIEAWWNKKVEELSKGMQQKIQFITTVLHQPKLLILDEPFSGFDPINVDLIKKEILQLRADGATVIFSTHNMESVEEICDDIALINGSRKILDGPVKEIRNAYRSNVYEISFKGNMVSFANSLWTGGEILESTEEDDLNIVKVKLGDQVSTNKLLEALLPNIEIKGMREILPSMNEIFIQKVNEINQSKEEAK